MRYLLYSFSTDVYYMASNLGTSPDKQHPIMSWAGLVSCHPLFSVLLPQLSLFVVQTIILSSFFGTTSSMPLASLSFCFPFLVFRLRGTM